MAAQMDHPTAPHRAALEHPRDVFLGTLWWPAAGRDEARPRLSRARWKTPIASVATPTPIAPTNSAGTPRSPSATSPIKNVKTTAV
jgi:hypothetical protein